jgi:RiboL-PSP-HEPN
LHFRAESGSSPHSINPFLTKYALIRACGAIEQSFKTVVADFCAKRSKKQLKRFLELRVRDSSMNPSFGNIIKLLKDFDESWAVTLKASLAASPDKETFMLSLQSLVDARNDFSHGGNPSTTIGDVLTYFSHSRVIIELLDSAVC